MSEYGGLEPTGRELREPAATLVELKDADDNLYTAVRYDEVFRGHQALTVGLDLIRSFLEYPMVIGLAEMKQADTQAAVFVFDTGPIWTLTEVLRRHRDIGQACGIRAALELTYLAAQILHEAGEQGPREGVYSHGNLTPWRIALRADGSVQVFAYGLPPVEWLCHRDDPDYVIDADSIRYAPPERLTIDAEDPAADSYALMLIAWEMMTGEPLIVGHDVAKLKEEISLARAQQLVSKSKLKGLPAEVRDLVARALIFDPDARLSGQELLDELARVLKSNLPGDSLAEIIQRIRGKARATPKGRKVQQVQGTSVFSTEQLAELAEADDASEEEEPEPETRWGKSLRRKKAEDDTPEDEAPEGRRRRRRADADQAEDSSEQERPSQAEEEASRRRRRRTDGPVGEAATDDDETPNKRRRRRRSDDEGVEDEADETGDSGESPASEGPPRRRRRRSTEGPDEAEETKDAPKVDESEHDDGAAPRRRRRRSDGADQPASDEVAATSEPAKDDEVRPVESTEADEGTPRRRRRRSESAEESAGAPEGGDDKPLADEGDDSNDEAPKRRRRRRG